MQELTFFKIHYGDCISQDSGSHGKNGASKVGAAVLNHKMLRSTNQVRAFATSSSALELRVSHNVLLVF